MTDRNSPGGPPWLTWGRGIAVAVFLLALLYPPTRLLALGYGIGWAIVECFRGARRALTPTDKSDDESS
jgi:hypothetical protein